MRHAPSGRSFASRSMRATILCALVVGLFGSSKPLFARSPYIDLGPSAGLALDQPRVQIELFADANGDTSLGPNLNNTLLLDTGASSILVVSGAVSDLEANPNGFVIDGTFEEQGVAGFTTFDVTAPYRVDFAGSDGTRHTLQDVRLLSNETANFGSFQGIIGMPAMVERITSLDMTVWNNGGIFSAALMGVDFPTSLPASAGHRYSVPVWPVDFEQHGDVFPTAAPLPFLTAVPSHNGVTKSGSFVFDTGAQLTIISERLAFDLGLDTNGNGDLNDEASGSLPIGGIGGEVIAPVMAVSELRVPTDEGIDLVWTDLQVVVVEIDPKIDGVFGSDLITSGWLEAAFGLGGSGYIDKVHFDFRNMPDENGTLLFDLNPSVDHVTFPPSASPNGVTPMKGSGQTYRQDFDTALGNSPGTIGTTLPTAWSAKVDGNAVTQITRSADEPIALASGTYNAGDDSDRSLALGNPSAASEQLIEWFAEIEGEHPAAAVRIMFDAEAWHGTAGANAPGEAAFDISFDVELDGFFQEAASFGDSGTITTGLTLSPGPLDGNASENRTSFDSGVVEVELPVGSTVRLSLAIDQQANTSGYLLGIDNVIVRTLAPGDADGNGLIEVDDLLQLLAGQRFNQGPDNVAWHEGDFDQDDDFDIDDLLAVLAATAGDFPRQYATESTHAGDASPVVTVNAKTGNITIDYDGAEVSAVLIESLSGSFNEGASADWATNGLFITDDESLLSNTTFTSTFSGVDNLGDGLLNTDMIANTDWASDVTVSFMRLGSQTLEQAQVVVVPEPSTLCLLLLGSIGFLLQRGRRTIKANFANGT